MATDPNDRAQQTVGYTIADVVDTLRKVDIQSPEAAKNANRMVDRSGTINYADKQF